VTDADAARIFWEEKLRLCQARRSAEERRAQELRGGLHRVLELLTAGEVEEAKRIATGTLFRTDRRKTESRERLNPEKKP
jgi:hypothetical protein